VSVWAALLPPALVGTERHGGALPSWPGEIGATIASACAEPTAPATAVLRAAAVLAACEAAGSLGASWQQALPEAAAAESLPVLRAPALLAGADWAWRDGPPRLLHEWCLVLAWAGWLLPPRLLPAALDAGRRSIALRTALTPVLGRRGQWLAAQHGEWRWASAMAASDDSEAVWHEGSLEQRREFLRRERLRHATGARERLAPLLPELPAKERAELVNTLATHLSAADEPLLDSLRADRSKEVRQAALELLLRLPDAQHPRRAAARLAALVTQERGLLRKRWVVEAPTTAAADWKDDNIDAARPKDHPLGERAWWLLQLVRQVPLLWWNTHTGMTAAELCQWASGSDWAEAITQGWRDVLHAAPEPAWCKAFLDRWPKAWPRDTRGAVLAHLPPAEREAFWEHELHEAGALQRLTPQWLAACAPGQTLSAAFSAHVARQLRQQIDSGALAQDWTLRSLAADILCLLHADALPALQALPRSGDESPGLIEALHTLAQIVQTRTALSQLTTAKPP
jgi:Family of unknown function (DUF5691)